MRSKISIFILMFIIMTNILRTDISAESVVKYDIDFSQGQNGIVKVLLNTGNQIKTKLVIQNGASQYIYDLKDKSEYESFPLQMGNGNYVVKIYENTTGTKYKNVYSESANIQLDSDINVYLNSNQQVKWSEEDDAIILANQLVDNALKTKIANTKDVNATLTQKEIINVLYNYVVKNITYDYDKIKSLTYDYVPDIDTVLKDKKGICFDYSALLASMLRSQGIPAKLIKGYSTTTSTYHAWNEVYLTSESRWIIVDTTYDAYMYDHQKTYTMEKSEKQYTKQLEF